MKITNKLAKEIFSGDFSNIDFKELTKDNKGRVNRFNSIEDLKNIYSFKDIPVIKKDFNGLKRLEIVLVSGEDYKRSKGHLQTDVLILYKFNDGFRLYIERENSINYKKNVNFTFEDKTRKEIIERIIKGLDFIF